MLKFLRQLFTGPPRTIVVEAEVEVQVEVEELPAVAATRRAPIGRCTLDDLRAWYRVRGEKMPSPVAAHVICRLGDLLSTGQDDFTGFSNAYVWFGVDGSPRIGTRSPFSRVVPSAMRGVLGLMSPEQVMGRPLDPRSLVFNLATMLYELLTGASPFRGDSELATLEAVRYANLPARPASIPGPLHDVLARALAVRPEDRFQTVGGFTAAVEPFLEGYEAGAFVPLLEQAGRLLPVPPEPAPLTPPLAGDDGARLVYADSLEEQGRDDEAAWLRLETRLRSLEGALLDAALLELRRLSARVGGDFMARVARPAVEGCPVLFGFKCPKTWDSLHRTEKEQVRHCTGCREDVHYCTTIEEAQRWTLVGGCVALDPGVVRTERDLDPRLHSHGFVGRLA